ncbi:hypothetical protein HDV02_004299 [Globomyces sp. JEL0801]|nr:hypothetical protein HDV02_004299 [Globomyces sp. JEL0801]
MKTAPKESNRISSWIQILVLILLPILAIAFSVKSQLPNCNQPSPLFPSTNTTLDSLYETHLDSSVFKNGLMGRFATAIQIPTVSFDSMRGGPNAVPVDPILYKPFLELQDHFTITYPNVHRYLKKVVIRDYSILYIWKGSNPNLKPFMFMAHQDVVPVDPSTANEWIHSPFSGTQKGDFIYGRGTSDTKMTMVSILEAIETLLSVNYQPERSMLVAFGHDEEISGYNGAKYIVDYITNNLGYGNNGIEYILDEGVGATIFPERQKVTIHESNQAKELMLIQVAEKGYMDLNVTVLINKGGHSSQPPRHTGIGILAQIITTLESNPYQSDITEQNPILGHLSCVSEHTDLLTWYEKLILKNWRLFKSLVLYWFSTDPFLHATYTTTQAVDVIQGGVKVNALPQLSTVLINQRIAPHQTKSQVIDRILSFIKPIAKQHELNLKCDDDIVLDDIDNLGTILLSFEGMDPSPISSTTSTPYQHISGTVRNVYGENVIVSPSIMVANTDTRWTWDLTENIFRMIPIVWKGDENIHTVNEKARIKSVVNTVKFYYQLIRSSQ